MAFLNGTFCLYFLGFISFLFVLKLKKPRKPKLNLPPSPPKLPIIGHMHHFGPLPHRSFRDLSLKYGPILWLKLGQIPALLVSSIDLAKEMIKNQDTSFAGRYQSISAWTLLYGCKGIAYTSYNESWKLRRKICVLELLSQKRVRSFQSIREEEVGNMLNEIRRACLKDKNCSVNISDLISATTNNVIFRCIIGQSYDMSESGKFGTLARKEMVHLADLMMGDFFPWFGRVVDVVTGKYQELRDTFKAADQFFDQVTEDHKKVLNKKDDDNKDLVDILLQFQQGDKLEFKPTHEELKALVTEMFLGGNETTTSTLEWIFTELRRNPRVMRKAQEEVRKVVGSKSKLDENDIKEMKYLQMVIKEAFRLHQTAPFLIPRETICDTKLGGYDIPAKTLIFVNSWAIQRDPQVWENPEAFIPERFENIDIDYKGQDFELLPFGSGRRMCLGMSFALASVEGVLANLLYWFDWKLPQDGSPECEIDVSETFGLTLKKKFPLFLQPIPYSPQSQSA